MILSSADWHKRFTQQAHWTQDLRQHVYSRLGLEKALRFLDVGCGTGVITAELNSLWEAETVGLDIERSHLTLAQEHAPQAAFTQGDAHQLPNFRDAFDVTLCHFLLLWVSDPKRVVSEMVRVTKPGGVVLALAEPDYGGRIDHPSELSVLGKWQQESLRLQGANPLIGRQLNEIFRNSGLEQVEVGVLGGQWTGASSTEDWMTEWLVLEDDMAKIPEKDESWEVYKELDLDYRQRGIRILYVPTFYAMGWVTSVL